MNKSMRNTAILLVVFLAVYMFGNYFAEKNLMSGNGGSSYSYEKLESDIAKDKVKSIEVVQNAQVPTGSAIVKLNDGEKKVAHVTDVNKVIDLAQQYKVNCHVDDVKSSDSNWLAMILPWLVIGVIMMFMFGMMSRASGGGGGGSKMMNFGKSRAKMQDPESQNIRFDQVAGLQEEKEELKEIVDFLKSPQKYIEVGARIPKGVILVGPPGTGKTLLAKAVSGEAGVPFFSISGSDFVEMFVGVGASRVRDLFKQATQSAPCIIFIDEIDAIGKTRDTRFGGNEEREQTLNQLLSEMDGFDASKGIMVMGATNRPEILDPALLRPGRFDRRIVVEKPDLKGRVNILKVHARDVQLDDSVDFNEIALATSGAVGADLANMMNEAAITAVKHGRKKVSQADLFEAVEVVLVGKEKKDRILSQEERRIVSYHEVGHALVSAIQKDAEPVQKITIVPRTMGALGYVMQVPEEEKYLNTKAELHAMLVTYLAGRAAEEIVFDTVTTGAANDIEKATKLARAMVTQYGMSERFGLMGLESQESMYLNTGRTVMNCGDDTATAVDQEVMKVLKDCYAEAKQILRENRDALDQIASFLIERETITGKEFMEILHRIQRADTDPAAGGAETTDATVGAQGTTTADAQQSENANRASAEADALLREKAKQLQKEVRKAEEKVSFEEARAMYAAPDMNGKTDAADASKHTVAEDTESKQS